MVYFDEETNVKKIGKTEWTIIKALFRNSCVLCGKPKRVVKTLEQAHLKPKSKGGQIVVPMCPTCHKIYDNGKCTKAQLNKFGITQTTYKRLISTKNRTETY